MELAGKRTGLQCWRGDQRAAVRGPESSRVCERLIRKETRQRFGRHSVPGRHFIQPTPVMAGTDWLRIVMPIGIDPACAYKTMVRITVKQGCAVTVVRIDGRLRKDGVAELERVYRSIEGPVCLDLANLQSVDAEGIRSISDLEAHGVAITGVSPYVEMLLKRAGHSCR